MSTTAAAGQATRAVIDTFDRYVVPNYRRSPVCLVRGSGSRVWDAEGAEYLDLFPGWGCNLLGHCPAPIVHAVQDQVARLIHVPNTWYTEAQGEWARLLSERSFGGQAFFCNSGTEANEAAIKLVRLATDGVKYKLITFRGGFHGRTFGSVTATAQPKYHEGLGPMLAGFQYAPHGDLGAVEQLVDDHTGGILVEPILGEGGIVPAPPGFLEGLRRICDERGLLLVFDEVQSGCGRTGEWFGYQHFGVRPDVITLAQSLCAGVAGGAMLTTPQLARHLRPGMHASTFGGNPLAARAGIAASRADLRTIEIDLATQAAQAIATYRTSQRLVEWYEQYILPKARETVQLTQTLYARGELTFLSLLQAQKILTETELAYVEAQADRWTSAVIIASLLQLEQFPLEADAPAVISTNDAESELNPRRANQPAAPAAPAAIQPLPAP